MIPALLIGALGGVIAALCGVGGGVVMVPLFVSFLGLDQKQAVGTSLAAIVLTALLASLKNSSNQLVNWNIALPAGIAGAAVAWFAADALKHFSNRSLTVLFGLLLVGSGIRMLLPR
jgi:hypothetical protein